MKVTRRERKRKKEGGNLECCPCLRSFYSAYLCSYTHYQTWQKCILTQSMSVAYIVHTTGALCHKKLIHKTYVKGKYKMTNYFFS